MSSHPRLHADSPYVVVTLIVCLALLHSSRGSAYEQLARKSSVSLDMQELPTPYPEESPGQQGGKAVW